MARTRPGSMASASLASHGPLRPTRRPGASQAASTWPTSLSPFSPAQRASPKGLPGLWANEACTKALSPRGGAALMLPPTTKRGPPAPLKLAPPTPPPFPRTQTRNRTHCRPLAGSTGSAEPAALPGQPGANLFGGIYNVDQLKLSPSSPSSSNFCKLRTLPARRFSFVFDTTQNLFFLSAFNIKNAVPLSLAAQARAWNSLLTVSATLRFLCARRSGLAERRPESRLQTIHSRKCQASKERHKENDGPA